MNVKNISPEYLDSLVKEAKQSPRARQHRNLHDSYNDPCQHLLNAIGIESYIRPHRHSMDPKAECLMAIRGLFALFTFNDNGEVQEVIRFGSEKHDKCNGISAGIELPPGIWHTVIALDDDSILLELKAGPFDPSAAKELALWAPEEQTKVGTEYLKKLRGLV